MHSLLLLCLLLLKYHASIAIAATGTAPIGQKAWVAVDTHVLGELLLVSKLKVVLIRCQLGNATHIDIIGLPSLGCRHALMTRSSGSRRESIAGGWRQERSSSWPSKSGRRNGTLQSRLITIPSLGNDPTRCGVKVRFYPISQGLPDLVASQFISHIVPSP